MIPGSTTNGPGPLNGSTGTALFVESPELVPGDSDFNGFSQLLLRDSSRFRCRTKKSSDARIDLIDRADAIDRLEHPLSAVIIRHRLGLTPVNLEALRHRRGVILGACAARLLGAALDALQQELIGHFGFDDGIEILPLLLKEPVKRLGLGHRAWVAIENEAVGTVGLSDPVRGDLDHDVVRHEIAAIHALLRPLADRRPGSP